MKEKIEYDFDEGKVSWSDVIKLRERRKWVFFIIGIISISATFCLFFLLFIKLGGVLK